VSGPTVYTYAKSNPVSRQDPFGLSPQDIQNAVATLGGLYPNLVNGLQIGTLPPFLDDSSIGGRYFPGTRHIEIQDKYCSKQNLTQQEKDELLELIAHETLHLYLDDQVGPLTQLFSTTDYHTWVLTTASDILNYVRYNAITPPPSLNTYPR
jgi:hypothetical protein